MEQEKVKKKANDRWQFILLLLVLILFAYYESKNRPTNVYSYTKEIKLQSAYINTF